MVESVKLLVPELLPMFTSPATISLLPFWIVKEPALPVVPKLRLPAILKSVLGLPQVIVVPFWIVTFPGYPFPELALHSVALPYVVPEL